MHVYYAVVTPEYLYFFNAVPRLAEHMITPEEAHVQARITLIRLIVSTEN